jgi:hypothetical protein
MACFARALVCTLVFGLPSLALAQTEGTIVGSVTDESQAVIPEIESHNPLEMSSADNPTCQRHCRLLVSAGCGVAANCWRLELIFAVVPVIFHRVKL